MKEREGPSNPLVGARRRGAICDMMKKKGG